ncbi:MAG TPA: type II toxin-antitoxin system RelE/ParE family toxin [Rhizomicrobium sp.]|jgi:toxin ParE1/3/4
MRFAVRLSDSAERDTLEIGQYIARDAGLDTAMRILEGLDACWSKLAQFPNRGNVPKELQAIGRDDIRELHYKPYRIFYSIAGDQVRVQAVVDGRRDIQEFVKKRLTQIG